MNPAIKRALAFIIDNIFIALYAGALYFLMTSAGWQESAVSPFHDQALGFATLTLPVFIYFFSFEKIRKGTPGKLIMKLQVISPSTQRLLLRNIIKFLPWEIAHAGIHWMYYFEKLGEPAPGWEYALVLVPEAIGAVYIVSVLFSTGGTGSLYDGIAGTSVISSKHQKK